MAAANNLFIFMATLFAVGVMLNTPTHTNAFWNLSKYPEPVLGPLSWTLLDLIFFYIFYLII